MALNAAISDLVYYICSYSLLASATLETHNLAAVSNHIWVIKDMPAINNTSYANYPAVSPCDI
jgi:hypothetical protein